MPSSLLQTTYTDIPANPRNVITLRRRGSPAPLFSPLPLVFRCLPRRLAPGRLKSPRLYGEKLSRIEGSLAYPKHISLWNIVNRLHWLGKKGEVHISLQNVAKGYMKNKTLAGLGRWPALRRWQDDPHLSGWPGQLFSIQTLISACPAWSTRSRHFNPRLVSSVGRAPVCWAGGHRFKPPPDQHSGSLNTWKESAAFVLWHLQTIRLSSLLG